MSLGAKWGRGDKKPQRPQVIVGVIQTVQFNGSAGEVQLMVGVSPDLMPVPLNGWSETFVERVRAGGRGLIGRRVAVWLYSGQPMIMDTMGV